MNFDVSSLQRAPMNRYLCIFELWLRGNYKPVVVAAPTHLIYLTVATMKELAEENKTVTSSLNFYQESAGKKESPAPPQSAADWL